MQNNLYHFTRVTQAHFPTLKQWLAAPLVQKWWGDPVEQARLLLEDIRDSRMAMMMNIVSVDDCQFAFIQDYEVHAWPKKHLSGFSAGTRAIDTFIGPENFLGLGHGSRYLRQRASFLIAHGASGVVIDPDVANTRAIRSYHRAGFRHLSDESTADGPVAVMEYRPDSS